MKMMKMFSSIPWEIVEHILSLLPVKSLLRFRCVSTCCLRLIDGPDFVKSHLSRSIQRNTNLSLVFEDHLIRRQSVDEVSHVVNTTFVPLEIPKRYDQIYGSCNGLVCLSDGFRSLILWNPSTRKFRVLPQNPATRVHPYVSLSKRCGFGYDSVNDDYKVVMILLNRDKLFDVHAYSLKFNSWHTVEKQPHHVHLGSVGLGNGVLAGGALHWVDDNNHCYNYIRRYIVAFDLASDQCWLVPHREYQHRDSPVSLLNFNGCLSVVFNDYKANFSIWVMREYRVKESWTKLVSVADSRVLEAMTSFPLAYHSVVFKDCGGILVYYKNKWILLSRDGDKIVETIIIVSIGYLCDHFGSLVPLN